MERPLETRRNSEATDSDLLRRSWRGEEEAFAILYRRHHGAVYRFALQMSGQSALAEEVTQEVFLLLMSGSAYDPKKGALPAFLYGVARNLVLQALRRERVFGSNIEDAAGELSEPAAPDEDLLSGLTRAEEAEMLHQAILSLPEPYREAVVLCELHELDYLEAAEIVGCPVGTVRSRLHRARVLLAWKLRRLQNCAV